MTSQNKIESLKNKLLASYNRTTKDGYKQTLEGLIKKLVNLSKAVRIEEEAENEAIEVCGNKIKHLFTMSAVLHKIPNYIYTYYPCGALMYAMPYYNSLPHGVAKGFHPCGAVKSECLYNNGVWINEKFYNIEGVMFLEIKNHETESTNNIRITNRPIKID